MKNLDDILFGRCKVRITGVLPEAVLNTCAGRGIELWDYERGDRYTVDVWVRESELTALQGIAQGCMCEAEVTQRKGGSRTRRFLKNHLWLWVFFGVFLSLTLFSSLFIWDIEVRGNETLSDGEIIRALAECGVEYGSYWPTLKVDLIRSEMIEKLPELAWMTVNVNGSRAVVSILERLPQPEIYVESESCDLTAAREGIIERVSVLNGKPLVSTGQSVQTGDVLIGGGIDSITDAPRYVRARGEVIARTWHNETAVCPEIQRIKRRDGRVKRRFALKFGKNRINFYPESKKAVDECDKIIHNYKLGMDGVFTFPVSLIVEELRPYTSEEQRLDESAKMKKRLAARIEETVDGEILSRTEASGKKNGLVIASVRCECRENIAEQQ